MIAISRLQSANCKVQIVKLRWFIVFHFSFFIFHFAFPAYASDWPTFQGGPLRKGVSDEQFKTPDRVGWRVDIREELPPAYKPVEFSVPVVSGDEIYVGTSIKIFFRLSARDGSILWSFKTPEGIESTATIFEDSVYFGDNSGTLYALQRKDGSLIWKHESGGEILSSPLVVKGIVYLSNAVGEVFALDAYTGKKLWQYKRSGQKGYTIRGSSSPSHDGSNLYVGFSDGFVVALTPFDGALLWEKRLAEARSQFKDIDASPVPDGDSLYVSFYDGSLYSLKAVDGSINWKFDDGGAGTPAIGKDAIFLPSSRGSVYSLDKITGKQNWAHKLEKAIASSIIAVDGYLLFGLSDNGIKAIDAERGEEKWRYAPGSGVYNGLAYSNGNLYFMSNGGFIYSIPCK
ncbi:MAG: hypothetical protein HW382_1191 [Deltaproteobacteria bacterium]|nr:hypothetical protein [Deltaproteobacteria bacterium]